MNKLLFLIPLLLGAMNLSAQAVTIVPSDSSNMAALELPSDTNNVAPVDTNLVRDINNARAAVLLGKAEANTADDNGVTPLMRAAEKDDIRTVVILIHRGANINALDSSEKTALDHAHDNTTTKSYLMTKGAVSGKKAK